MAISILRFDMRRPEFAKATRRELYEATLDMAAWADEKGFDAVVLSEHHTTDDGYLPSPVALAGCIVGRTRRLRISIQALLLPLHDPLALAEDLAVLDLASGGRLAVTAGLGYRREEYAMFGADWDGRGRLMDECIGVLLKAWTGKPFEYRGRTVRVSPTPFSEPHPMLMVGGMGRNAARRAARFGLPFQPAVNEPSVLELYKSECERLGVANPLVIPPGSGEMIWVAEDPDGAWAELGPHLLHDAMTYAAWQPEGQRSAVHSDATSVEALRAEGKYLILTPEECIERDRAAAFSVFVHFPLCGGTHPDLGWRSLKLYADRVLPEIS